MAEDRGGTAWREPGNVQRLAGIDVPETGDDALVQQRRLERGRWLPLARACASAAPSNASDNGSGPACRTGCWGRWLARTSSIIPNRRGIVEDDRPSR